jgi:hypothetical protein
MDEMAEKAQLEAMRRDLDDLRRVTAERRLLRHGSAEFDAMVKREEALIRRIRAWSQPPSPPTVEEA